MDNVPSKKLTQLKIVTTWFKCKRNTMKEIQVKNE